MAETAYITVLVPYYYDSPAYQCRTICSARWIQRVGVETVGAALAGNTTSITDGIRVFSSQESFGFTVLQVNFRNCPQLLQ